MKKSFLVRLAALPFACALIVFPSVAAQAQMFESQSVQAAAAGLGAGLAASASHGQVVRRSMETMSQAQQATLAQTKAIQQYMALGCKFEASKQWDNAEKSYRYVLTVIARRDGPGSSSSVPALEHLVTVSKEQHRLDQALDFQQTVVAFAKKGDNAQALLSAQIDLTNLFLLKQQYQDAETVMRDSVAYCDAHPTLPQKKRRVVYTTYAKLLHQMHRDLEAAALEAAVADGQQPVPDAAAVTAVGSQSTRATQPSADNTLSSKAEDQTSAASGHSTQATSPPATDSGSNPPSIPEKR